jgi:hypothetical protein
MMSTRVALLGAGGKMGCRITDNLKDLPEYEVAFVEVGQEGVARLQERGLQTTPRAEAVASADVTILAVPDRLIGRITAELVPALPAGSMLMGLDPAAAHAGVLPLREDLSYFVTHPCHPPLFNDDTDEAKRKDWFGGVHASQHIVCALHQGPDEDYAKGERVARDMYGNAEAPVLGAHRVTVEQMAMLEPVLVETFAAMLVQSVKELADEIVARGVPEEAVHAFLMGHLRTIMAIVFGHAGFPFSDGAMVAINKARGRVFQPDWKQRLLDPEAIRRSVGEITDSLKSA